MIEQTTDTLLLVLSVIFTVITVPLLVLFCHRSIMTESASNTQNTSEEEEEGEEPAVIMVFHLIPRNTNEEEKEQTPKKSQ